MMVKMTCLEKGEKREREKINASCAASPKRGPALSPLHACVRVCL